MRRRLAILFFCLFFAIPLFAEGQETLHSNVLFRVKSAEIFYTDAGVWIEFTFFLAEARGIYALVVPVNMLSIEVGSKKGTQLVTTYKLRCSSSIGVPCSVQALIATLVVSKQSIKKQWQEKIDQTSREYENVKLRDVLLTTRGEK